MVASRPFIFYNLPKGTTTQALIGRKIEKAWDNVKLFLANATTANAEKPTSISLTCYSASEEFGESPILADQVLKETQKVFGTGEISPIGYHYPSGKPSKQIKIEWRLTSDDLTRSIDYIIKGQPWPKYNLGPIDLIISYNFLLIDPTSKVELPNQQFESSILIWLSRSNYASPTLYFPFEEPDNNFENYISRIEPFLPFKLERKYLRLGRSNKRGTSNVYSKL